MLEKFTRLKLSPAIVIFIGYNVVSLLITAIWFNSADLLIYTDTHFPFINLGKYLERIFTIPDTAYFPASYDIRHLFLYTYPLPFFPLTGLWGLQLASLMQRLWLFTLLLSSCCSISYFLFYISKITKQKLSWAAIFITALLYIFNTYAAIIIWRPFMPYMFHYALFPLFATLSLQYFSANEKKYLLALMLLSFFIFPSYTIIHSLIFDFVFIMILLMSTKTLFRKNFTQVIYTLIKTFAGILILSIPILLVTLSDSSLVITQYSEITKITHSSDDLIGLIKYNSPNIRTALFYSGYPPLYTSYFDWYKNYTSHFEPLILVYTGGLLTIGILTCTKRKNVNQLWFGLLIAWLIFLILFTGSNNPFSDVKLWIFQMKFFDLLRSVYARFGEYVIITSLPFICVGLSKIVSLRNSKIFKVISIIFLSSLVLAPLFPVLNADFLRVQNPNTPSNQVHFPNSYQLIADLNNQKGNEDFLYMTIPSSADVNRRFWNNGTDGYIGPDIFPFILNGASIRNEKIRSNVLNFIIHGKFKELQEILSIKYVILTFDQHFSSIVQKETLTNYLSIFEKQLELIYLNDNLVVFELPSYTQNELNNWRVIIINQKTESIVCDLLSSFYHTIVFQNHPLEATYILNNYIGKVFELAELNLMKINSTVNLNTASNDYYIYPIYIVFPNVSERIYLAAEFKPEEKYWNIYTGFWSAETTKWNYNLITNFSSSNLTFIADFTKNIITIKDNSSAQEFQIPEEWSKILDQHLETTDKTPQQLFEIGIFASKNLTEIVNIDAFFLEIYDDNSFILPSNATAQVLESKKISPTLFKATINATEPFSLAFLEAYSPSWRIYVNGVKVSSVPLYGVFNGFWINQTGFLEITIEYEPQKWFYYGSIISVTSLLVCLTYMTHDWTKNKTILKRVKKWSRSNS